MGALAALLENLEEASEAFVKVSDKPLSWEQIRSVIELSRQQPSTADGEGVKVLLAHDARGLEAEVVYLLGVGDEAFPAPADSSQLLADETIRALRDRARQQLPIPTGVLPLARFGEAAGQAQAEEARLFYSCLTRASDKLVISCHLEEDGAKVGPSEFLYSCLTRASDKLVISCHLEEDGAKVGPSEFLVSALPDDFVLGSVDEQQTAGFECIFWGLAKQAPGGRVSHQNCPVKLCAGRPGEPTGQEPVERAGRPGEPTGQEPVELEPGSQPQPSTAPILAELVPDWPLSASSINSYLSCPRRFFFEKLIGLAGEDPEVFVYGSLLHEVMAQLNKLPPSQRNLERALSLLDETITRYSKELSSPYSRQLYHQRARWALEAYAHTEQFREESIAQEQGFEFDLADEVGEAHRFRGRIDHIVPDGDGVDIVDYKSGKVDGAAALRRSFCYRADDTAKEPSQRSYQLPLYALGWEKTTGGRVQRVCLQSLSPDVRRPCHRSCVEVVSDTEPPGGESVTTEELTAIAHYLAELARTIKQRPGFAGHPPREGCTAYFACPYVLICSEAEPG